MVANEISIRQTEVARLGHAPFFALFSAVTSRALNLKSMQRIRSQYPGPEIETFPSASLADLSKYDVSKLFYKNAIGAYNQKNDM